MKRVNKNLSLLIVGGGLIILLLLFVNLVSFRRDGFDVYNNKQVTALIAKATNISDKKKQEAAAELQNKIAICTDGKHKCDDNNNVNGCKNVTYVCAGGEINTNCMQGFCRNRGNSGTKTTST